MFSASPDDVHLHRAPSPIVYSQSPYDERAARESHGEHHPAPSLRERGPICGPLRLSAESRDGSSSKSIEVCRAELHHRMFRQPRRQIVVVHAEHFPRDDLPELVRAKNIN